MQKYSGIELLKTNISTAFSQNIHNFEVNVIFIQMHVCVITNNRETQSL